MKPSIIALLLSACFVAMPVLATETSDSLSITPKPAPPSLAWQTTGGMLYGAGGMLVGGIVGAGALSAACLAWGEDCGFAGIGGAFMGGLFGFAGTFPLGVYHFGLDDNHTGSLWWTYASTALGAVVGFGGAALITQLDSEDAWFQSAMFGLAGVPMGALIGFNATRKPIQGMPQVSVAPIWMKGKGGFAGNLTWRF